MTDSEDKNSHGLRHRLKPSAPAGAHLLLAALLWSTVGGFLLWRGLDAAVEAQRYPMGILITAAVTLGLLKGFKVMRPVAKRGAARIIHRGDGRCLGGFISWKSWLLVVGMMVMGRYLRALGLPPWFVAPLVGGVGLALLWGSTVYWAAFFRRNS